MIRIGGSEAAAILGVSPYRSPLDLYLAKVGIDQPEPRSDEWLEWGLLLEPIIAKQYGRKSGRQVRYFAAGSRAANRTHPDLPWMGCALDGEQEDLTGERSTTGVLEIKNQAWFRAKEWDSESGGVPIHYAIQAQHNMAVTGYTWATFPVLIGGNRLEWIDLDANQVFQKFLIEKETEFVRCVEARTPPLSLIQARDAGALTRLYAPPSGEAVTLPDYMLELAAQIDQAAEAVSLKRKELKTMEGELDLLKNQVRAAMGHAVVATLPDGSGWTWKEQKVEPYTVEGRVDRILRRTKAPKGKKA